MSSEKLRIVETFTSIQGESTHAGKLCFFIRTAGCNLNCGYCDTDYAKDISSGFPTTVGKLLDFAKIADVPLVEITGGEPMLQKSAVINLCKKLLDNKFTVLLETNGSFPLSDLPEGVHRILDFKCPSSGESEKMIPANFAEVRKKDEVKFVISCHEDFVFALEKIKEFGLTTKTRNLLFSPVPGKIQPSDLAKWMIDSKCSGRLQLQIHKYIWPGKKELES